MSHEKQVFIALSNSFPSLPWKGFTLDWFTGNTSERVGIFLVGSKATLPINLYLQVRDGSTPVINAISFLLIVGTSMAAFANLYFSKKSE